MKDRFKLLTGVILSILLLGSNPVIARAGWMDKISQAAGKLNQNAPAQENSPKQPEDPDHPLHLEDHYQGSCHGQGGATCLDYGELVEMLELIDELQDSELLHLIKDGREGLQKNKLGINAEDSLARLRSSKRN